MRLLAGDILPLRVDMEHVDIAEIPLNIVIQIKNQNTMRHKMTKKKLSVTLAEIKNKLNHIASEQDTREKNLRLKESPEFCYFCKKEINAAKGYKTLKLCSFCNEEGTKPDPVLEIIEILKTDQETLSRNGQHMKARGIGRAIFLIKEQQRKQELGE